MLASDIKVTRLIKEVEKVLDLFSLVFATRQLVILKK